MQPSANSRQSSRRRAPSREETNYPEPPGLGTQSGTRSAYIEIRNPRTSLSSNEIHDSQRRANTVSQEFHMQEPPVTTSRSFHPSATQIHDVRPGIRQGYVANNHEAFRMDRGNDGVRGPSTPSYPAPFLRRQSSVNGSSSEETSARYATSPHYESGVEMESLNYFTDHRPGYSKRSKPGQPTKSLSADNTIKNVPSTLNSNNLHSRQQPQPHGVNFPSTPARSNNSVSYAERIQPRTPVGGNIPQDPRLAHEKATNWHNTEEYPASDDQGRQFPPISIATEPHETTQGIDWKALDQSLEHMIENIYAEYARNRAESYSQRATGPNHIPTNVVKDDQTMVLAEEGDGSLSSDESDLTDSDGLEEDINVYNPVDNPSILPSVNIDRTAPYTDGSRGVNVGRLPFQREI